MAVECFCSLTSLTFIGDGKYLLKAQVSVPPSLRHLSQAQQIIGNEFNLTFVLWLPTVQDPPLQHSHQDAFSPFEG